MPQSLTRKSTAKPPTARAASSASEGTQAIRRAAGLLRAIAKAGATGQSLAAVAHDEGLPRSTVHRMLGCLNDEGLVERGPDLRWRIGPLVHELALAPASSASDIVRWRPAVEAVARRTGVTAYLMRRSGAEAVCLIKVDGEAVVRFVPVDVGQRRPLGVGAGATALLAALKPADAEAVIDCVAPHLSPYPRLDAAALRAAVAVTRKAGYAISQGTVADDGFGMGLAIPTDEGVPRLAVSIAAHASMVTESSITAWQRVLWDEVRG